ncbi:UvrD-helicase domain-containing protein [Bacteroidota bacterium]
MSSLMSETERKFLLFRSSAGSGKTYNLAQEYLSLVLKYPDNYKRVLAVTFTNKSTNEMKTRIVNQLAAIAEGNTSSDVAIYLEKRIGFDPEQLQERAKEVLTRILHGYSFFAVSTIDSFFQRIISAFTRETGISGGYGIELDKKKVLTEVVDQIYQEISDNVQLRNWLVRYSEAKVDENKSWDVRKELIDRGMDLLKEDYQKITEDVKGGFKSDNDKIKFLKRLQEKRAIIENTMSTDASKALEIMDHYDLDTEDFTQKNSGVGAYFLKLSRKVIEEPNNYVKNAIMDKGNWFPKTSSRKKEILNALDNGLYDQLIKINEYYQENKRIYYSIIAIQPLFYGFAILLEIENRLSDYRLENRVILVSDLTKFLRIIIGENDTPFIYEKTGSIFHHFLIDEFQDTSSFQWDNFRPLVDNALAQNRLCLAVGDVKQSIYRWRGGDWRIITRDLNQDIGSSRIEIKELDTNWRSLPVIVDFNNYIFKHAPNTISALLFDHQVSCDNEGIINRLKANNQVVSDAYSDAIQKVAEKNLKKGIEGKIQIQFFDDDKDAELEWKEKVLHKLPEILESLQDDGLNIGDIAILVREKKDGARVANYLMDYQNSEKTKPGYRYSVISSESLFLPASHAIRIIINTMQLLYNSDDRIALFNILYYSHLMNHSNQLDLNRIYPLIAEKEIEDPAWIQFLPDEFLTRFHDLATYSLHDLTEELIRIFKLNQYPGEYAFLMTFQDTLLDYHKNGRGDLEDFLGWWLENGSEISIQASDGLNAARILTIHKSKGLQFKAVIIPFCDWDLDHSRNSPILWCKNDDPLFESAGYLPVRYGSKLNQTFYEEEYYTEQIMAYMDNLNLLYVAMTRAEEAMYVFGNQPKIENDGSVKIKRSGDLLYSLVSSYGENYSKEDSALSGKETSFDWDENQKLFCIGKVESYQGTSVSGSINLLDEYISGPWIRKIQIRSEENEYFESVDAKEIRSRINYGLIVHDILSRVIHKNQLESALKRSVIEGSISQNDKKTFQDKIKKLWEDPKINDWFSGNWQVKTEVPVLPKTGDLYRLDRVMIKGDSAIVVDYKTGSPTNKDKDQVNRYIQLLREMGFKKVEGYLLMIEKNELLKVAG